MGFWALIGALGLWCIIVGWTVRLVHSLIGGDISFLQFVLTLYAMLAVGALAIDPPDSRVTIGLFLGAILITALVPVMGMRLERRDHRGIALDEMRRTYEALAQRPQDPLLRVKLAKSLYALGDPHSALAVADTALQGLSKDMFRREHQEIRMYGIEASRRPAPAPRRCARCRGVIDPTSPYCPACGDAHYLNAFGGTGLKRPAIPYGTAWAAAAAMLAAVPLTPKLPPPWGYVSLALTLIVGFSAIVWTLKRGGDE